MNRKKTTKKGKPAKNGKSVANLDVTSRSGLIIAIAVSVWMFVLGVLIGRGTVGPQFDVQAMEKEMNILKAEFAEKQKVLIEKLRALGQDGTDLEFYEALEKPGTDTVVSIPVDPKPKTVQKKAPSPDKKKGSTTISDLSPTTAEQTVSADPVKKVPEKKAPETSRAEKPEPNIKTGNWTIQVASLQSSEAAIKMTAKLKKQGFDAYITPVYIEGKGVWYRIGAGKYRRSDHLDTAVAKLAALGYKDVVRRN